jgi:signal transduction histidine kinase
VTDERGVWSDTGAALQIDIPPTFVQSRGFLVMCLTAGLLLLWLLHRLRVRQLTARERARMADLLRERERIARELHDTLLQSTQALMLRFGAAARSMSLHPAADGILRATLQSAEDVIAEGRDRIHNLRAAPLAGGDLGHALSELGRELAGQYGTQFASHTHGRLLALPAVTEDALFRIGREALLNAFAHAGARRIDLTLSAVQDTLHLKVSDDGVGLPPEVQRDGFAPGHWGLQGMREQTERLQGKLQISGRPDGGTQVDVSVPLLARRAAPWTARLMHLVSRRRHRSDD